MSRKDAILKAAKRTAREAREAASRKNPGRFQRTQGDPHRHCVVCWSPIPLDREPPICGNVECSEMHEKRERSRKRLTIMMYLFPAIAVFFVILQIMGASG
ncbi:MAG: DUF2116 family Zn-ribbon domain-containing protein [Candidatus Thalassarchaeaceae archaeon]|nr:DUF2116 family Zn-ribbon domain-containing protein [Candidatus Thalassarchaeaceae archaeon]